MTFPQTFRKAALAIAILALTVPLALAIDDNSDTAARSGKQQGKVVPLYPNATRSEPKMGVSVDMDKSITKFLADVNANKNNAEVIATGQRLAGDKAANSYERAVIDEGLGFAYLNSGDKAKGVEYLQKVVTENSLPNNDHFSIMLQLAKSQIAAGDADAGLATLDRVVAETKDDKPEYNGIRGRVYYAKKDYAKAAIALQKSIDASTKPDPNEQQMLLASYFELKQPERAEKIGQEIVLAHPDDKAALLNLASIYQQEQKPDKAAAVLDDARKRGLLTDANDYRRLYALYSNIQGRENDSASVINEGLQKGILQPSAETYTVLAEDYYFTKQFALAIEAYKKADALSTDGEAALNLAKVYNNQGKAAEAKAAAELALKKGVKQPAEARGIIERAGAVAGEKGKKPPKKK